MGNHQHPKVELEPGTTRTMTIAGLWHEGEGQYGPYLGCQVALDGEKSKHMLWIPSSLIQKVKDTKLQEGDEIAITTTAVPGKKGMRKEYVMRTRYLATPKEHGQLITKTDEETAASRIPIQDPKIKEHVDIYKQCLAGSLEIWSENGVAPPPQQIGATATSLYIRIAEEKAPRTLRQMYETVKGETLKIMATLGAEEAVTWKDTLEYVEMLLKKCELETMIEQHKTQPQPQAA